MGRWGDLFYNVQIGVGQSKSLDLMAHLMGFSRRNLKALKKLKRGHFTHDLGQWHTRYGRIVEMEAMFLILNGHIGQEI